LIRQKARRGVFISYRCVKEILRRRLSKIPRILHYQMIKELENLQLLKRVGNSKKFYNFELTANNIDKSLKKLGLPI
jgi:hypothetical protein